MPTRTLNQISGLIVDGLGLFHKEVTSSPHFTLTHVRGLAGA